MLVLADWTAPVGAIGSAIAAGAALVAIFYARQAATAGRDAVRIERDLRVEAAFREFGQALWSVFQYADDARREAGTSDLRPLRHAQTRLISVLVTPVQIALSDEAYDRLDVVMSRRASAVAVYSAAAGLIDDIKAAWEASAAAAKYRSKRDE
jgi:hypothetical protein